MGRYKIHETERARRDIEDALTWWLANRRAAPRLLRAELGRALYLVSELPRTGAVVVSASKEVRRLLLRRTGYRLEYRIDSAEKVTLLRLVHMSRRDR